MRLTIVPEGPLAFDGKDYIYSEGEGYYIDRIAGYFDHVTIIAHAFRPEDEYYKAIAHRPFEAKNISVVELPIKHGILGKFVQIAQSAKLIWKHLNHSDIHYVFMPGYSGAISSMLCQLRRKDYFLYLASDWPEEAATLNPFRSKGIIGKITYPIFHGLVAFLQNQAVRGAKFVMTAGTLLREKYANYKTPVEETVPRINWPVYCVNDRKDSCQNDEIILLFVGYLLERKGAHYFVDALKILRERGLNIKGIVIGEGEEEAALKAQISAANLDGIITLKGHIPNGEPLIKEWRAADIYICPTTGGEGFPRVVYEAMSQGLPTVVSDVCGISLKVKPEHNGLFVPPHDATAIADQVQKLIDNPVLRQSLIQNGYDFMRLLIDGADGGKQIFDYVNKYVAPLPQMPAQEPSTKTAPLKRVN